MTTFLEQLACKTRKALSDLFGITTDEELSNFGVQSITNDQWAKFKSMIGERDLAKINRFMLSGGIYQLQREIEPGKAIIEYQEESRDSTLNVGTGIDHKKIKVDRLKEIVTITWFSHNPKGTPCLFEIRVYPSREWIDEFFKSAEHANWQGNYLWKLDAPRWEVKVVFIDETKIVCPGEGEGPANKERMDEMVRELLYGQRLFNGVFRWF